MHKYVVLYCVLLEQYDQAGEDVSAVYIYTYMRCVALCCCVVVVLWCCVVVLWCCGVVVLCCGVVMWLCCGVVLLWCCVLQLQMQV